MYFHPSLGASITIRDQLAFQSSFYESECSGQEETLVQCPRVNSMVDSDRNDLCVTGAVFVKCFITDEKAELDSDCQPPETYLPVTALPTTTTATASRTTVVTITAAGSSPPLTDTEPGMMSTATQPTSPTVSASTLYYIIGGLSATIILTGTFLIVVFLITCCYCRRKQNTSDSAQLPLEPMYEYISSDTNGGLTGQTGDVKEKFDYLDDKTNNVQCSDNPAYETRPVHTSANPAYETRPMHTSASNPVYETHPMHTSANPAYETRPVHTSANPAYETCPMLTSDNQAYEKSEAADYEVISIG